MVIGSILMKMAICKVQVITEKVKKSAHGAIIYPAISFLKKWHMKMASSMDGTNPIIPMAISARNCFINKGLVDSLQRTYFPSGILEKEIQLNESYFDGISKEYTSSGDLISIKSLFKWLT